MADRSVTVQLDLNVKPYLSALAKAEAATRKFRDGLGGGLPDPFEDWDKETQKRKRSAPKEGDAIAGAFSRAFSRRLESAFRSLPKAKIDADSTDAQKKLQEVRASLQTLSAKQINVDIDAAAAMAEVAALQAELERLGQDADIDVRADTAAAMAQLQGIQRDVDKLSGAQPTVRPDVDASAAKAELAELQRRLAELSYRHKVGVDLDDGAARSELSSIQRDLERLNATHADPKIRVDSAAALAQVRSVQSEMSRVDGRSATVKVDADVSGALAKIAMVAAALASLPTGAAIGLGIGALGAAFSAAGAGAAGFAAVAVPGISRVTDALKQAESASGGAGGAMKSAGQKAAEAASAALRLAEAQDRVTDSARAVKSAQQAVRDAMSDVRSAQQDAARAAEDAADRQAQAAARIADSERSVQDAHRATQRAIEDLTRAREAALERIEDLALASERGALSEERAKLSIRRAQAELDRINASNASPLDKEDAALRLREAELALREIQERNGDLAKEREDSDKKGVEGSDEVVAAKERILAAQRAEADAERSLAEARAESARVARDGARDVADAQSKIAEAQRKVTDAQQEAIKAQRDHLRAIQALKVEQLQQKAAMDQAGSAAGGAATKMAKLSDAEQKLAKSIKGFQDDYLSWQRSLQPDVFPVIEKGLDVLRVGMDRATPLVKGGAEGLGLFADAAKKALESKEWTSFFDDLGKKAPDAIEGLGNAAINVAGGLRGVVEAFLPYTGPITDWVENITQDFEDWGTSLKDSSAFKEFLAYAAEQGPKVAEVLGNIATFVGNVLQVGSGAGSNVLDFLVTLSDKLAGMDQAQIEAIAKGVGLIVAAVKIGASLKIGALVLLAEVLSGMSPGQISALATAIGLVILAVKSYQAVSGAAEFFKGLSGSIDGAGKSADGAKGKLSNLASLIGKGGVIAAAAAGTVLAVDAVSDALDGLNPNIDEVAKGLAAFGKGGEPAAALLDQLDPKMASMTGKFESFADSAARLTSNNSLVAFGNQLSGLIDDNLGVELDGGRQGIDNLDKALSTMVGNGNGDEAAAAFNRLARQALEAGTPMDKLKELFPEYAQSLDGALPKTADMAVAMGFLGVQVDPLAVAMDRFNTGLDTFNAKTDLAEKTLALKDAFDAAKDAIDKAGGKLEFTSRMTDKQREAVVLARDQFGGYIGKVLEAAKAAGELAGKSGDAALKSDEARDAFLRQLEPLFKLAGNSKEAKDRIYDMAAGFGVNRDQADKAAKGVKGVKDVIAELKSKEVTVSANTEPARRALRDLLNDFIQPVEIPIGIRAPTTPPKKKERGGIERYAAGGARSTPPNVTSTPTILYGEGAAAEYFIPTEMRYRDGAEALLAQAANEFGLSLNNQQAAQTVSDLSVTIDDSGLQISDRLTGVMGSLESTMGQAGSLTSSIGQVGASADQLNQAWLAGSQIIGDTVGVMGTVTSDAVTVMTDGMTSSIDTLSVSVADLGSVLSAAAEMTSSTNTGGAVGATAKKSTAPRKGKPGKVDATAKKTTAPRPTGGLIAGDYGLSGTPDWVTPGGSAMSSMSMGAPANSSRMSAPQQMHRGYAGSPAGGPAGSGGSVPQIVNKSVNFNGGQTIKETADADVLFAKASMSLGGRG